MTTSHVDSHRWKVLSVRNAPSAALGDPGEDGGTMRSRSALPKIQFTDGYPMAVRCPPDNHCHTSRKGTQHARSTSTCPLVSP